MNRSPYSMVVRSGGHTAYGIRIRKKFTENENDVERTSWNQPAGKNSISPAFNVTKAGSHFAAIGCCGSNGSTQLHESSPAWMTLGDSIGAWPGDTSAIRLVPTSCDRKLSSQSRCSGVAVPAGPIQNFAY